MKTLVKKRLAKRSDRGIYLQDRELQETEFEIGSMYTYRIDHKNKRVIITKGEDNTVSKRKIAENEYKPVIDIRKKEAIEVFTECDYLKVYIYQDEIIIEGYFESSDQPIQQAKITHEQLYELTKEIVTHISISTPLRIASLFSGSGMFDYAFHIDDSFEIVSGVELDTEACRTYKYNIGDHVLNMDITEAIPFLPKVPIIIGGSPCQGFSPANRRTNGEDNENSKLVRQFIRAVRSNEECKVFVLENVPQLLGTRYENEIRYYLDDFHIEVGVLDASEFGGAQRRKRAFMIGTKIGSGINKIKLPIPLKKTLKTVRQAFAGLHDGIYNQGDVTLPKKETIEKMNYVPEGGNFLDIPKEIRPNGQHSNLYRRLEWDKPSISLPNVRKSNILHPEENRILSVREIARLFDLPDSFRFFGSLSAMQQQVSNGVALSVGKAIMKVIKNAFKEKLLLSFG